ncbi:MAG: anti-sigma factor antagonist [Lachnospiraceae bacterium]|nr:anti-sigma factor antagonist [Lachnospiraceae bacterium]MDE6699300.1 anti-sigma factor antagonist [Lachnospiraceae bacterium]
MNYEIKNGEMRVILDKELDHHNASLIKDEIDDMVLQGKVRDIIFDFEKTSFMDSSGIGIIMGRYKLLKTLDGKVYVTNISGNIERIFVISGLYKIIERK